MYFPGLHGNSWRFNVNLTNVRLCPYRLTVYQNSNCNWAFRRSWSLAKTKNPLMKYIHTYCSNQYTLCKWKLNYISYFSNFIKLLCNDVHCGEPIAYTGTWYAHWMWLSESFLEPKRLHDHQTSFQIVPHFDIQKYLKHCGIILK